MYLSRVNWRTANFDGGFKLEQIGLLEKDFSGSNTELFDLRLRELDLLPRPRQSDLREPSDDVIEHGRVHPSLPLRGHSIRFSQIPLRTAPISPRRQQKEETLENPNEKTGVWRNSMPFLLNYLSCFVEAPFL